jgi:ParB family chromosome partitioning protein
VVVRDVDDTEMLELALVENIQRKDLTAFEESEALQSLGQRCGYTHEDLAKRLGKSRTSITESLSLNGMPPEIRKICRLAGITSKSVLLQVVRQGDAQKMLGLVERIASQGGATREQLRQQTKAPKSGRPKAFVFNFKPSSKAFNLRLSFNKKTASKDEIISALEAILEDLRNQ